jgi:uncharacterized membrane protein YjfL (UPF0719 family)
MPEKEEEGLVKVLKWAGILALVAVPVYMIVKKVTERRAESMDDDEANIFASEFDD